MAEKWRFLDFEYYSPEFNMALDEAIMDWHSQGLFPPTIRFYGWNPPTLSIGYFQQLDKEISVAKVEKYGLGLVRRLTGGRAVLHDQELTYSVVVSEKHPIMPKTVTEAYRVISLGLLEGFKELGLNTSFAVPETLEDRQRLNNPRSSICFDAPSWYELVVEGRKVAGSAQTRQKGVIMQHGSILIELDESMLFDLFIYPNERVRERLQKSFKNKAVAINDISQSKKSLEEVIRAFKLGFERGLDIELEAYRLNGEEIDYVNQLAKKRYGTAEWNYRR